MNRKEYCLCLRGGRGGGETSDIPANSECKRGWCSSQPITGNHSHLSSTETAEPTGNYPCPVVKICKFPTPTHGSFHLAIITGGTEEWRGMERWRFLPFEPSRIPTSSSTPASVRTGEPAGSWIRVSEHLISTQFRWLESTYKPTNPPLPRKELSITEAPRPIRISCPDYLSTDNVYEGFKRARQPISCNRR